LIFLSIYIFFLSVWSSGWDNGGDWGPEKQYFLFYFFRSGAADGTTVVIGALTMLKQFHMSVTHKFLAYLGQYVRCQVVLAAKETKVPIFYFQFFFGVPRPVCALPGALAAKATKVSNSQN